ncbi:MAG: hypothetical protein Kow00105_00490 [Phycisphaeraceae bacterium]
MLFICLLVVPVPAWAQAPPLNEFRSRSYLIHTNLSRDEARVFGLHMDAVFAQYEKRFRDFRDRGRSEMPLYLLRTEADYHAFMQSQDIDSSNTGGMFFYTPRAQGLATWTQGRSRGQTLAVLQHEGFHQFAFNYLGRSLPIWINEGLAQYFEDAIVVRGKMITGLASEHRITRVRQALEQNRAIEFDDLIGISSEQWSQILRSDPAKASLLYAQSWSVVFYLIHGENEKYQPAFVQYLKNVSTGRESRKAMRAAFGTEDLTPLGRRWARFALRQQPDPINTAASRMEFLGEALKFIHQRGEKMPRSIPALRDNLRSRQFVLTRQSHNMVVEFRSENTELYQYQRNNGSKAFFKLLEPARDDLLPRITAPGLKPEPTLVWSRDADGQLVQDIEYR